MISISSTVMLLLHKCLIQDYIATTQHKVSATKETITAPYSIVYVMYISQMIVLSLLLQVAILMTQPNVCSCMHDFLIRLHVVVRIYILS